MSPSLQPAERAAYKLLQLALLFCLVVHVLAMGSMATVLAPAMDMSVDVATRAAWVAENPWRWRLGWLPWQGCALSDILVSGALLRWALARRGRYRGAVVGLATVALLCTVAAVIPEQWAEGYAVTTMPSLDVAAYAKAEVWLLVMTGTCGGLGYDVMLVFWVLALAVAAPPSRWKTLALVLTGVDFVLFAIAGVGVWQVTKVEGYPDFFFVQAANTVAFPLLCVVNVLMAGLAGQAVGRDLLGGIRDMTRPIPFLPLRSDITDVVYLNWWVPAERVRALLPAPHELDVRDGKTAISILHYRHGGFGWAFLGPLRRLLPNPVQSNWRLYVAGKDAIYFLHTLLSSAPHALGARVFSDGLPGVWDRGLTLSRQGATLRLQATVAPLRAVVTEVDEPLHPDAAYLIEQNSAVSTDPVWGVTRKSGIEIPIDLSAVRAARVDEVHCEALSALIEGCDCFAFVVPSVRFVALGDTVEGVTPESEETTPGTDPATPTASR